MLENLKCCCCWQSGRNLIRPAHIEMIPDHSFKPHPARLRPVENAGIGNFELVKRHMISVAGPDVGLGERRGQMGDQRDERAQGNTQNSSATSDQSVDVPEWYLVVITESLIGQLHECSFGGAGGETTMVSYSVWKERQEAMLLMRPFASLKCEHGSAILIPQTPGCRWRTSEWIRE